MSRVWVGFVVPMPTLPRTKRLPPILAIFPISKMLEMDAPFVNVHNPVILWAILREAGPFAQSRLMRVSVLPDAVRLKAWLLKFNAVLGFNVVVDPSLVFKPAGVQPKSPEFHCKAFEPVQLVRLAPKSLETLA